MRNFLTSHFRPAMGLRNPFSGFLRNSSSKPSGGTRRSSISSFSQHSSWKRISTPPVAARNVARSSSKGEPYRGTSGCFSSSSTKREFFFWVPSETIDARGAGSDFLLIDFLLSDSLDDDSLSLRFSGRVGSCVISLPRHRTRHARGKRTCSTRRSRSERSVGFRDPRR